MRRQLEAELARAMPGRGREVGSQRSWRSSFSTGTMRVEGALHRRLVGVQPLVGAASVSGCSPRADAAAAPARVGQSTRPRMPQRRDRRGDAPPPGARELRPRRGARARCAFLCWASAEVRRAGRLARQRPLRGAPRARSHRPGCDGSCNDGGTTPPPARTRSGVLTTRRGEVPRLRGDCTGGVAW
jgi:hypothetical protein